MQSGESCVSRVYFSLNSLTAVGTFRGTGLTLSRLEREPHGAVEAVRRRSRCRRPPCVNHRACNFHLRDARAGITRSNVGRATTPHESAGRRRFRSVRDVSRRCGVLFSESRIIGRLEINSRRPADDGPARRCAKPCATAASRLRT